MRFLRRKDAANRVGLSTTHIMRLSRQDKFPKPVQLGDMSVAFVETEIDEWMEQRLADRDGNAPAMAPEAA